MNRYTLLFCNGGTMDFESDQSIPEIMNILNTLPDEFVNIGEAAIVQRFEVAAIYDNDQTYKF